MTTQTQDQGSWIEDGDFKFINEGSIMLVQPMNDDASQWLTQTSHAAYEAGVEWQFFGRSLVIEPSERNTTITVALTLSGIFAVCGEFLISSRLGILSISFTYAIKSNAPLSPIVPNNADDSISSPNVSR